MVAGVLPTVQVLLDDGTGTFPYDISAYARMPEGITGARGRQDELSQVTAPQPTLVLDNQDGRFSYGSTLIASPSPILVDQQIRVKYTANGTTVNRYTGTLVADNVSWPGGGDEFAIVNVTLADVQAQAERHTLLSVPEEVIRSFGPVAYFLLNEPSGAAFAYDVSGNEYVATPTVRVGSATPPAVGFGASVPAPFGGGLTAATFTINGKYLNVPIPLTFGGGTGQATFVALFIAQPGTFSQDIIADTITMTNTGQVLCNAGGGGVTAGTFNDGLPHVVVVTDDNTHTKLYVDGTLISSTASAAIFWPSLGIGGSSSDSPSVPGTITVGHAAYFNTALTAGNVTDITNALTGAGSESGTARLTRLAGYAGIPVGTLDTSLTNVPFADITGKSAMAAFQDVADAEFGLVFFDGSGNLTFHNRNRPVAKTAPDITIDANHLDPGTSFFYDSQGILNYVQVTAQGTQVTQVAWNKVSELGAAGSPKHGRYPDQKTYLVLTDAEALDRGNWLVNRHGQPAPRAGSLVVDLLTMTAAQQAAWLVVEPNTWVRVTGLPAQTPGGTTADLIVQGWAETLNATTWTLALNTASRPAFYQAWILDDATYSVLDSTTRLFI